MIEARAVGVLALALLAGCVTTPSGRDAPTSTNIVGSVMSRPAAGTGILVIRRDRGLLGVGCGHLIRVDGKFAAELSSGEEVTLYPPPGEYVVEVRRSGMFCDASSGGGMAVKIESGKRKVYRTGHSGFGTFIEQATD